MKSKIIFLILIGFWACKSDAPQNVYKQATFTEGGIRAVVEIPAGTNHKIEYNPDTQKFKNDVLDGKDRVINFLPYPGNYGFIPSTLMDATKGGDGDALDIFIIGESIPTGETIEVLPIGTLLLKDKGEIDSKIIAIPRDESLQVINPKSYEDFLIRYNAAHHIIQEWFMNYKGLGVMELVGWKDEQYALKEIKKWSKEEQNKEQ